MQVTSSIPRIFDKAFKNLTESRNQKSTQCLNDLVYEYIHGKPALQARRKESYIPLPKYVAQSQKWQDLIPTDIPYPITQSYELWKDDVIRTTYTIDDNFTEDFLNQAKLEDCIRLRFISCIVGFFLCDRPMYHAWRTTINPKWGELAYSPKSIHNQRFDVYSLFS